MARQGPTTHCVEKELGVGGETSRKGNEKRNKRLRLVELEGRKVRRPPEPTVTLVSHGPFTITKKWPQPTSASIE